MGMLELVVVILGIIVAGGFLLYFVGDLFMSIATKGKSDTRVIGNRQATLTKELEDRLNALPNADELKKNPAVATILLNGGMIEQYNPDEEDQLEEELAQTEAEDETVAEVEELVSQEEKEEELEEIEAVEPEEIEEEDEEESTDEIADYIAKRRQELMEKLARIKQESEEPAGESLDLNVAEEAEEEVEDVQEAETVESETVEEVAQPEAKPEPVVEPVAPAVPQAAPQAESVTVKTVIGNLVELEEKLALVQDKLKANEKELRRCKKEYIPLRKVKKTLEKDENKLRRKEALVAKQKIMLYGVNNYSDIDEEKAKKLAEDLDLLDGLKLSVQHCHEVMNNNRERYPLLEQIYNLLVTKNNDLKEEIKSIQQAIDKIKNGK